MSNNNFTGMFDDPDDDPSMGDNLGMDASDRMTGQYNEGPAASAKQPPPNAQAAAEAEMASIAQAAMAGVATKKLRPASWKEIVDAAQLDNMVRFNTFSGKVELAPQQPIWTELPAGTVWTKQETGRYLYRVNSTYRVDASFDKTRAAVEYVARCSPYNPVSDWLCGLQWDRVPRLTRFFATYCGGADRIYEHVAVRVFFIGLIKRAILPGTKHDIMLILEGKQEILKSSILKAIVGEPLFTDSVPDLRDMRQTTEQLMGKWLIEFPELNGLHKVDINRIKHFLSKQIDDCRLAYGHEVESLPRTCNCAATYNPTKSGTYLTDTTGNRRFLPVSAEACNVDLFKRDREQLFAEAMVWFRADAKNYIHPHEDAEAFRIHASLVGERMIESSWDEHLDTFITARATRAANTADPSPFDSFPSGPTVSVTEFYYHVTNKAMTNTNQKDREEINEAFARRGWTQVRIRMTENGKTTQPRRWRDPECKEF